MGITNYWSEHHKNCGALVRDCKALSVSEVAELYAISQLTVRRKIKAGSFPMFKIMNRIRGFKCWITVAIRNPELIKENLGEDLREVSLTNTQPSLVGGSS